MDNRREHETTAKPCQIQGNYAEQFYTLTMTLNSFPQTCVPFICSVQMCTDSNYRRDYLSFPLYHQWDGAGLADQAVQSRLPWSLQSRNTHQSDDEKTQRKCVSIGSNQTGCTSALSAPILLKQCIIANILVAMPVLRTKRWKNAPKCYYITRNGFVLLLANRIKENNSYSHNLQNGSRSNRVSHSQ